MKKSESKIGKLSYDEKESILYVETFNEVEMSLENLKDHNSKVLEITGGKKHVALVDVRLLYYVDAAGVKFAADSEAYEKRMAVAFYGAPLANRLGINLLKMQEKANFPIKVFLNKEEGLNWLKEFKKTANFSDN